MANSELTELIETKELELNLLQQAINRHNDKLDELNTKFSELTDLIAQLKTL